MIVYTKAGVLPVETFAFPDGQPHVKLVHADEWRECTIETAIRNAHELLQVLLAKDVLTNCGYVVNLDIRYLMGARMDRAIDARQPFTLNVIARQLLAAGFARIRVLDPHSPVTLTQLRAQGVNALPIVARVLSDLSHMPMLVAPDAGALPRVQFLTDAMNLQRPVVACTKKRDSQSGTLSGFVVNDPSLVKDRTCLIVDDICDGGGTFVGLAARLREAGAMAVSLYVTHGILSKGTTLEGIDRIFTTDSYSRHEGSHRDLTVFPVSMKEML